MMGRVQYIGHLQTGLSGCLPSFIDRLTYVQKNHRINGRRDSTLSILTLNSLQKAPSLGSHHEYLKSETKNDKNHHYHHHTKYHRTQSLKPNKERTQSVAKIPIKRAHILKDVRAHSQSSVVNAENVMICTRLVLDLQCYVSFFVGSHKIN